MITAEGGRRVLVEELDAQRPGHQVAKPPGKGKVLAAAAALVHRLTPAGIERVLQRGGSTGEAAETEDGIRIGLAKGVRVAQPARRPQRHHERAFHKVAHEIVADC